MCVYEDMSYEYLRTRRNVQQINTIRKFNQTRFVGTRTEINTAHIQLPVTQENSSSCRYNNSVSSSQLC